jgi:hypothetical protein
MVHMGEIRFRRPSERHTDSEYCVSTSLSSPMFSIYNLGEFLNIYSDPQTNELDHQMVFLFVLLLVLHVRHGMFLGAKRISILSKSI